LLLTSLLACSAQATPPVPGTVAITSPTNHQTFQAGNLLVPCAWTEVDWADTYSLKLLFNGTPTNLMTGLTTNDCTLEGVFMPGYYTLFVGGVNGIDAPWSSNVTFVVERKMIPSGTASNRPPATFQWTRNEGATRYRVKLAQFDKALNKYVTRRDYWLAQPATGAPKWRPAYSIPDGKFRWTVADYKVNVKGYTQSAYFQVKQSGDTNWNDPSLIKGKWKVVPEWRWRAMTFQADGYIRSVQGDGTAFTRARWYADEGILTMISDVTEKCPYTVTDDTLTFTLPSGNVKVLTRIP
jgi:hypothetical protein